jgi:hypothetical protein
MHPFLAATLQSNLVPAFFTGPAAYRQRQPHFNCTETIHTLAKLHSRLQVLRPVKFPLPPGDVDPMLVFLL